MSLAEEAHDRGDMIEITLEPLQEAEDVLEEPGSDVEEADPLADDSVKIEIEIAPSDLAYLVGKDLSNQSKPVRRYRTHIHGNQTFEPKWTPKGKYECPNCQLRLTSKALLDAHSRAHLTGEGLKCDICNKTIASKFGLKQHMRVHTGEKPHQCPICEKFFTQTSSLNRHMLLHTRVKSFPCDKCGITFAKQGHLDMHIAEGLCRK